MAMMHSSSYPSFHYGENDAISAATVHKPNGRGNSGGFIIFANAAITVLSHTFIVPLNATWDAPPPPLQQEQQQLQLLGDSSLLLSPVDAIRRTVLKLATVTRLAHIQPNPNVKGSSVSSSSLSKGDGARGLGVVLKDRIMSICLSVRSDRCLLLTNRSGDLLLPPLPADEEESKGDDNNSPRNR